MALIMIKCAQPSISDIREAIEYSRKDVYCSEEITEKNIANNPWVITMRGPDNSLGAIVGLDIIHKGVAYGWAVTTQNLRCFPLAYTKKMEVVVEEAMNYFELHRLQILVKCRSDLIKWAEHLGFSIEGKMLQYGVDRSDYYIMGRIRE
jgi:hypothetical protein